MLVCQFIKTSSAGNRTLFILGKPAFEKKREILEIILRKKNIEAEQIGFIWKENQGLVLNMAGAELCGGAILATPVLVNSTSEKIKIISLGLCFNSAVAKTDFNKFTNETEFPLAILKKKITVEDGNKYLIQFHGIAYLTIKGRYPSKTLRDFLKLEKDFNLYRFPCLGFIEVLDNRIIPTVWVKKVKTIITEQGCTTGTISAQLAFPKKNGRWIQPSGLFIQSEIMSQKIKITAGVEKLARGVIFVNNN